MRMSLAHYNLVLIGVAFFAFVPFLVDPNSSLKMVLPADKISPEVEFFASLVGAYCLSFGLLDTLVALLCDRYAVVVVLSAQCAMQVFLAAFHHFVTPRFGIMDEAYREFLVFLWGGFGGLSLLVIAWELRASSLPSTAPTPTTKLALSKKKT